MLIGLDGCKDEMAELYDDLKNGKIERKVASELANIAGKYLKAEQLALARDIFTSGQPPSTPALPAP